MALWGNTDADEAKPKWLTADQKENVYATDRGWVQLNGKGLEEVICAIGELSTSIAGADINEIEFTTTSFSEATGGNIDLTITFNEKVTVVTTGGTPTITLTNSQAGSGGAATVAAAYQSGSSTNRLVFRYTQAADDGSTVNDVAAGDVLSVAAQNITLNGGTIKDAGTAVNSGVAVPAGEGTLTAGA
jgi:hypothetical protein